MHYRREKGPLVVLDYIERKHGRINTDRYKKTGFGGYFKRSLHRDRAEKVIYKVLAG